MIIFAWSRVRKFNVSVNDSKIKSYCLFPQSFFSVKIQIFLFCKDFRHVFDRSIKLETAVTWSNSNLHMMNIYEESTINFWIWKIYYYWTNIQKWNYFNTPSMIRKLKVIVYFRKVFVLSKFKYFCFVKILDMSLISRSCKNDDCHDLLLNMALNIIIQPIDNHKRLVEWLKLVAF
jgi:hypothetical protein